MQPALAAFPTVNHSEAARELDHRPRPIEQTIAELRTYFQQAGLLPDGALPP